MKAKFKKLSLNTGTKTKIINMFLCLFMIVGTFSEAQRVTGQEKDTFSYKTEYKDR